MPFAQAASAVAGESVGAEKRFATVCSMDFETFETLVNDCAGWFLKMKAGMVVVIPPGYAVLTVNPSKERIHGVQWPLLGMRTRRSGRRRC